MNKLSIAIFLSLTIAAMPHLGFTDDIEMVFYTASGIVIAALIHLSRDRSVSDTNDVETKEGITVEDIEALNIERMKETEEDVIQEEDSKPDESRD